MPSVVVRAAAVLGIGALSLTLSSCGGDHPVPQHGTVTDRDFTPAWVQYVPGITTCGKYGCTTTPGYPIYWPDRWDITVTDLHNPDWVGTVEVSHDDYDHCRMHALWPDCTKKGSTDA